MFNYIKADFYRIFSKTGLYFSFCMGVALMLIGLYISANSITESNLNTLTDMIFILVGTFGGTYLFSTVYNDDLEAKTLPSIVGFGKKRGTIVISKLCTFIILSFITFFIVLAIFYGFLLFCGFTLTIYIMQIVFQIMMLNMLKGIALGCVASIVTYGWQKGTAATVLYLLTWTNIFEPLISIFLDKIKLSYLSQYLISPITSKLVYDLRIETIFPYILYITIFTCITVIFFKARDLEF